MPPFASSIVQPHIPASKRSDGNIVTLNVGGRRFQTTRQTLALAGPTSLLADPPAFIDRDPNLFSLLLSLLRTNRLPSSPDQSISDLIAEAGFYGIDPSLLSNPSHFDAFDLAKSQILPLNGRDPPSAIATDPSGAIHVAHGGKVTSFDWSLSKKSTVLTRIPAVDSILSLHPSSLVAAGAVDFPGLHIIDLGSRSAASETLHWNVVGSGSAVQAIGASPEHIFGSFESIRRTSSAIVAFDRATLKEAAEMGRREVYGAELDSAIPATKLKWVDGFNLLLASGSHAGPSGLTGNIRLWDVRAGGNNAPPVWEITERGDCFADVAVSDAMSGVFKVGAKSGEVFMMDLRKLGSEWIRMAGGAGAGSGSGSGSGRAGGGCMVECHGGKVFVSRGGEVEMWSEVVMGRGVRKIEDGHGAGERVMMRNLMGRRDDRCGNKIVMMGFGGMRMVVVRKDAHCIEVWESSAPPRP